MKIFDKVAQVLAEISGMENIRSEQELQQDLGLDSLQMVLLLISLEEAFQIVLNESDMNPFDLISVQNVVDLAEKYVGGVHNENN